ncbi:MAG: hypothetical protein COU29_03265 [Candidatus Magasanikbacteria bacterium CG10_big_fil_rev_8_21_14_0_10_36_32]|uniref:Bacterial sugar transferase domain-containing protein n=1 Tax=Candidatus Magasanikbacteria bacterium CG10_big_fil_rev_8_21_14_0_10_36_32 TaxID=1974646 RepID=A0A2M6W683_9BACT|nr:MAG: hypothetical protein COU29_03265 [Candidatus Magasanikbacteria bacterium CG10_big_fil_rev_8_21_14_0_10_36_32]
MYYRFKQIALVIGDMLLLYVGLYFALVLRYWQFTTPTFSDLSSQMIWLFILAVILLFIMGLYDLNQSRNSWPFFQKIIIAAIIWLAFGIAFFYINPTKTVSAPKTILLLCTLVGFGLVAGWRFIYNHFISTSLKIQLVFAGFTKETAELIDILQKEPEWGYAVAGIIGTAQDESELNQEKYKDFKKIILEKNFSEINHLIKQRAVQLFVVAPSMSQNQEVMKQMYADLFYQVGVINLANFYEEIFKRIPPFTFSESWFIENLQEQNKKIYDRGRILMDYFLAVIMSIFFAVTFPIIALLIKITSRGPVFINQERVGRLGKTFRIYKYRTMKSLGQGGSAEINGPKFAAINDPRITLIGKLLRKSRLDEVPQFINILKGEMSIIGPRPERPEFVTQLTDTMPFYNLRHLVKPGLTGWAQLQNSYYGTMEENLRKLEYDLFYIKNRNVILDLVIVLKTFNILGRMVGR